MLAHFLSQHHIHRDDTDRAEFEAIVTALEEAVRQGASCIDLSRPIAECSLTLPIDWAEWLHCNHSGSAVSDPSGFSPLILEGQKLYLARYYDYETTVARELTNRLEVTDTEIPTTITPLLDTLFDHASATDQRLAAEMALQKHVCVIAGGPGTGKTTTVVNILFLLTVIGQIRSSEHTLLLAPTGKAADRLSQSIRQGIQKLIEKVPKDAILASSLPHEASTIHRALGYRPNSTEFRHHKDNRISANLVIIDETSMVDLPLMAKLLEALPLGCKLIFLGDQNQLSSVQVGSVLADLMQAAKQQSLLTPCATSLQKTFRTSGDIKTCCDFIRQGDAEQAWRIASSNYSSTEKEAGRILTQPIPNNINNNLIRALEPFVLEHWLPVLKDDSLSPQSKLEQIDRFRILTPTHLGPYGVRAINHSVDRLLAHHGIMTENPWFIGRSIIVTSNQYSIHVFNGDTGIVLPDPQKPDSPVVYFSASQQRAPYISPTRLPSSDTAWALTIHRTQGSEYEHILLILPPDMERSSQLISRELLYTGLSRAKVSATIWCEEEHFKEVIHTPILRPSGLADRFQP